MLRQAGAIDARGPDSARKSLCCFFMRNIWTSWLHVTIMLREQMYSIMMVLACVKLCTHMHLQLGSGQHKTCINDYLPDYLPDLQASPHASVCNYNTSWSAFTRQVVALHSLIIPTQWLPIGPVHAFKTTHMPLQSFSTILWGIAFT